MTVETRSEPPAPADAAGAPEAPRRRDPLWRAQPLVRWPVQTAMLAVLAGVALLWLAAELLWPVPDVPVLNIPKTTGQPAGSQRERQSVDTSTFIQTFGSRKLFIPEVPVEQYELSGEVVDEMLGRMRLASVFKDGQELVAMVDVQRRDLATSQPGRGVSGTAGSASVMSMTVRKGDQLLDFKVEEVTPDGLELSIGGFKRKLTY